MPRTAVALTDPTRAGLALNQTAADTVNGNYIDNPDRSIIFLNNPTGGAINVTIQYSGTWDGLAVAGRVISCAVGFTILGGFRPGTHYQDADLGRLYIDAPSASLLLAAIRFPVGS